MPLGPLELGGHFARRCQEVLGWEEAKEDQAQLELLHRSQPCVDRAEWPYHGRQHERVRVPRLRIALAIDERHDAVFDL